MTPATTASPAPAADETLLGGDDQDIIAGGAGADVIYGGLGNDSILGDSALAVVDIIYGGERR